MNETTQKLRDSDGHPHVPQESVTSLFTSLLSMPRSGLNAGMDMVYGLPTALSQGSGYIYASASNAVDATCGILKNALPYINPLAGGDMGCSSSFSDSDENSFLTDVDENHFKDEGPATFTTEEDLKAAIEATKDEIMSTFDSIDERRTLVAKLIELRLQLQEFRDTREEKVSSIGIKDHRFESLSPIKLRKTRIYCEACGGHVWTYIHSWYRCKGCGYTVHGRCTELVRRTCALSKARETRSVQTKICPEKGLHVQLYACAECGSSLSSSYRASEPRLCDYSGLSYCPTCHWKKKVAVPARIIHNWDFQPREVSNASYQYLRIIDKVPVIDIEALNPKMFGLVEELSQAKILREAILFIKGYLMSCNSAADSRLLCLLKERSHFVEGSKLYSVKDLKDLKEGKLLKFLEHIHQVFRKHVEEECEVCQLKGSTCGLCMKGSLLFGHQTSVSVLKCCDKLVHKECFLKFGRCVHCAV